MKESQGYIVIALLALISVQLVETDAATFAMGITAILNVGLAILKAVDGK